MIGRFGGPPGLIGCRQRGIRCDGNLAVYWRRGSGGIRCRLGRPSICVSCRVAGAGAEAVVRVFSSDLRRTVEIRRGICRRNSQKRRCDHDQRCEAGCGNDSGSARETADAVGAHRFQMLPSSAADRHFDVPIGEIMATNVSANCSPKAGSPVHPISIPGRKTRKIGQCHK